MLGGLYVGLMPRRANRKPRETSAIEYALLTLLILMFSPLSFNYFYVWLLYPLTLALHLGLEAPTSSASRRVLLGSVVASLGSLSLSLVESRTAAGYGNSFFAGAILMVGLGWKLGVEPGMPPHRSRSGQFAFALRRFGRLPRPSERVFLPLPPGERVVESPVTLTQTGFDGNRPTRHDPHPNPLPGGEGARKSRRSKPLTGPWRNRLTPSRPGFRRIERCDVRLTVFPFSRRNSCRNDHSPVGAPMVRDVKFREVARGFPARKARENRRKTTLGIVGGERIGKVACESDSLDSSARGTAHMEVGSGCGWPTEMGWFSRPGLISPHFPIRRERTLLHAPKRRDHLPARLAPPLPIRRDSANLARRSSEGSSWPSRPDGSPVAA